MSVLDKVKEWFIDEEEEPVKAEKTHVEIASPEPEKEKITESEVIKQEEKPAPVFFNEEDFQEITATNLVKTAKKTVKKEEAKIFRPSPIISPVYGVLDKNYLKEEIKPKRSSQMVKSKLDDTDNIDIDWIRKKAYGTLDDDLEQELLKDKHVLVEDEFVDEKDLFDEMAEQVVSTEEVAVTEEFELEQTVENNLEEKAVETEPTIEPLIKEEIEQEVSNSVTEEINEVLADDLAEENDEATEKMLEDSFFYERAKSEEDSVIKEHRKQDEDLFNLIDTMYEKGEND